MGSVAWGKQSRGRRRNVASASGVGSLIMRQVCAPAAHEAAPPTGCRLDRDAAGLKEARRRRGGPPDVSPAGRLAELEPGGAHYVARCMMNIAATA